MPLGLHTVPLEGDALVRARELADAGAVAAHHHPCWLDVLRTSGEEAHGIGVLEGSRLAGWLLYAVRRTASGSVATSLPYLAYGGPSTTEARAADLLVRAFHQEATAQGVDAVTVGWSPFSTQMEVDAVRAALGATHEVTLQGQVQPLDVHPIDALPPKRRDALRSEARRAPRMRLRAARDADPGRFEQWIEVYRSRMMELGVAELPTAYLRALRDFASPAGAAEFWSVVDGDRMVGGVVFLTSRRTVEYYLSAFRTESRSLSPNTYLLCKALDEFRSRGVARIDWQGSGGNEGVRSFKARWGAVETPYGYLCCLLRSDGPLLRAPLAQVREAFPHRFVLPYSAWPAAPISIGPTT
jgi:CelD/BcsL family acetyltransferase involved in cellulose biosynthesis